MMRALLATIAISLCSLHHSTTIRQDSNDGRVYLSPADLANLSITLPALQTTLQPLYVAPISTPGNDYQPGQCVWGVKNWRPDIPNNWGNADTWLSNAQAENWPTGTVPRVGAVGQEGDHVVLIVAVNGDGTVTTREMNEFFVPFQVTSRTVPANFFTYIY